MFMCSMLCQRSTSSAQWMTRVNGLTAEKRECFRSKTAQRDIPGILIEQIQKCHIIRKLVILCWCQAKWKKEVILSLREFLEMQDRYFQKNAADLTCDFSTLSCRRGQGTQALQNWRNLTARLKTNPDVCTHPPTGDLSGSCVLYITDMVLSEQVFHFWHIFVFYCGRKWVFCELLDAILAPVKTDRLIFAVDRGHVMENLYYTFIPVIGIKLSCKSTSTLKTEQRGNWAEGSLGCT